MWNKKLGRLIATYPSGVLSIVEDDGYPASIRCQVSTDAEHHRIALVDPPALAKYWRGPANLLFHEHDDCLERLRQMALAGVLIEEEGSLIFVVEKFITANGRADSDQMPHASSPLHMIKFFLIGWRKARHYLAKREEPWPPIPYDEITRLVDAEADPVPPNAGPGSR